MILAACLRPSSTVNVSKSNFSISVLALFFALPAAAPLYPNAAPDGSRVQSSGFPSSHDEKMREHPNGLK